MPVAACYDGSAIEHLRHRVRECEQAGVTLLCCPEGALGGLADYVDAPDDIALPSDAASLARQLQPLASETVTVVVGFTERDVSGRYYNAAAVYLQGVVCGVYRKRHPAIRRSRYSAGTESPVFVLPSRTLGILICRDSLDDGLTAGLGHRGADVLCIPSNNAMPAGRSGPRLVDEVRALDRQHATTSGVPLVRADVIGEYRGLRSAGATMVTASESEQVCAPGSRDGELVVVEVPSPGNTGVDIAAPAV